MNFLTEMGCWFGGTLLDDSFSRGDEQGIISIFVLVISVYTSITLKIAQHCISSIIMCWDQFLLNVFLCFSSGLQPKQWDNEFYC